MGDISLFPPPPTKDEVPQGSHLKGWAIFLGKIGGLLGTLTGRKDVKVVGDMARKVGQVK